MPKKIQLLIMILVAFIGFMLGKIAFKPATPPKDFYRYFNEEEAYSIRFPNGWRLRNNRKTSTVMSLAPQYIFTRNRQLFMVHIFDLPTNIPIEELEQNTIEQLKAKGGKIYEQGEGVIDNLKTVWHIESSSSKPDLRHLVVLE